MRALAVVLLAGMVALSGCGGSAQNARVLKVCRTTKGHVVDSPVTGSIVALGRPPVYLRIDNPGQLEAARLVLAKSDYPGWFAIKSQFFTPPTYRGGFSVTVRAINGATGAGIGDLPPGGKFSVPAGRSPQMNAGWREWPAFSWVKGAGCYEYTIKAGLLEERVVVAALNP